MGAEIQYIQLFCVNGKLFSILNFKTFPCNIFNFCPLQQCANEVDKAICTPWDEEIVNI